MIVILPAIMTAHTAIINAPETSTETRARSVMAPITPRSGNNFRIMGCGLTSTFFFAIFLVITIPFFDDMNYDVTHEHCHNRQKREERKPVDLRWVIHRHTIAPERPLSSINICMISFKQFLAEGGEKMFGIEPFGKRAQEEAARLWAEVGGIVEPGKGSHTKLINPVTKKIAAVLATHGSGGGDPYKGRLVLKDIARELKQAGSKLTPKMTAQEVSTAIAQSGKPPGSFPMASGINPINVATELDPSITSTKSPSASLRKTVTALSGPVIAGYAGEKLAEPVKTASEEIGLTDLVAKGISAIIPNEWLAAGESPAEQERRIDNEEENTVEMPSPMGFGTVRISKAEALLDQMKKKAQESKQ